jgi:uncharacterized protein YjbJ (UPF0337 family)
MRQWTKIEKGSAEQAKDSVKSVAGKIFGDSKLETATPTKRRTRFETRSAD